MSWMKTLATGIALWVMILALLLFLGNLAASKFIYVDF